MFNVYVHSLQASVIIIGDCIVNGRGLGRDGFVNVSTLSCVYSTLKREKRVC